MEFYVYQKVNGLPLPRTIQPTAWSQNQNLAGYDPLTLPLSRVLRGGSADFWLRMLAAGRNIYLAPMGEASHLAFVTALLHEFRQCGLDLTQVAQNRAAQEGFTLEGSAALLHLASSMMSRLQTWIPNPQQEAQAQEKIAALKAELSALKSRTLPEVPTPMAYVYSTWFRQLDMDGTTKTIIEKNILAIGKWWATQPDEAKISTYRMATCFGISGGKTISDQNKHLLEILKVAVTMSSWLSTQLKTTTTMKHIMSEHPSYVDILPMWIWQNVDILLVDILPLWISFRCGFSIWIWQNVDILPMWISFLFGYPPYMDLLLGFGDMWISFLCGFPSYVDLANCGYPSYVDVLPMWISFLDLAKCGYHPYVDILPMWISFLCGFPIWIWQNVDILPIWRLCYVDFLPMWISSPMWIWQNVGILLEWISFLWGYPSSVDFLFGAGKNEYPSYVDILPIWVSFLALAKCGYSYNVETLLCEHPSKSQLIERTFHEHTLFQYLHIKQFHIKHLHMGFALFVPTYFGIRPPFKGYDSNVYYIIYGTTTKNASFILAGELVRRGDFTMWVSFLCRFPPNVDLAKCGSPSYVDFFFRFGKMWISFLCGYPSYVDFLFGFGKMWTSFLCGYPFMWISFLCGFPFWIWQNADILPMWIFFLCGYPSYVDTLPVWMWQNVRILQMWRLHYMKILPMWIPFLCGLANCGYPSYMEILPMWTSYWNLANVDIAPMWKSFLFGYPPYRDFLSGFGKMWISFLCGYPSYVDLAKCGYPSYVDVLPSWISFLELAKCGYPPYVDILPMWTPFLCGFPIWICKKMNIHPMWIPFGFGKMWIFLQFGDFTMWTSFLCGYPSYVDLAKCGYPSCGYPSFVDILPMWIFYLDLAKCGYPSYLDTRPIWISY